MNYNRIQIALIGLSVIIFFSMYFGCETKAKNIKDLEKSRSLSMEVTGVQNIINDARKKLTSNQLSTIETLSAQLEKDTATKLTILQTLSAKWYEYGQPSVAGNYAEEMATIKKDEESWAIAGTTYTLGMKNATDPKEREFCKARAVKAFENAISLDPDDVSNKINLALCYVENPSSDNPMQGILMLRELNAKNPENVAVINQLARLALKTNQIDKALERLAQAEKLDSKNKTTICLLAEAYAASGDKPKADMYRDKCMK
jgi:tetratricopeptide (TPR) repeat protein